MIPNPILQEIYSAREQILAEYDGDLAAYIRSANERAKASGHPIAKLPQRKIRGTGVVKSGGCEVGSQLPLRNDR